MTGIPKSSVKPFSPVSLVSEPRAPTETLGINVQWEANTFADTSALISSCVSARRFLASSVLLSHSAMKDSRWSMACMIRQRIMNEAALCARCSFAILHNAQTTSKTDALRKNRMTLCRTSYIWPLACKPDPVPLIWHINIALHWNFLPMQEQQAQRQKHWNKMKWKDRIVLPLDPFHHRKIKWKINLTKVTLLSRRVLMLNLFLWQGSRLQEPGTEQQVWDPRNARSLPAGWANGVAKAIINSAFSSQQSAWHSGRGWTFWTGNNIKQHDELKWPLSSPVQPSNFKKQFPQK